MFSRDKSYPSVQYSMSVVYLALHSSCVLLGIMFGWLSVQTSHMFKVLKVSLFVVLCSCLIKAYPYKAIH